MQRFNLALVAILAAIGCDSADPEARSVNDGNDANDGGSNVAAVASAASSEAPEDESADWFEARLARVEVQERERLFELVALDHDDETIGRISLSQAVDGSITVRHQYPDGEMTVRWTQSSAGPAAGTTVVDQTLSDDRITDRAGLIADVYAPQVAEASALACALTIAASGAACFATPPPWVAGTCPAGIYATVCACRSQIKKTFDFDFTVCDDL